MVGRDVKRYEIDFQNRFLIFTRRGINLDVYPAVREYLLQYRDRLEPRPNDWKGNWEGRKPGPYKWYEVQDTVAYFEEFEKPKIVYAEIATQGQYQIDYSNYYADTTVYILNSSSKTLLAIMNSKIWTFLVQMVSSEIRGGFLRWKRQYVSPLPIPKFPEDCSQIENAVDLITEKKAGLKACTTQFTRLVRRRFDVEQLPQKLESWHELDYKGFCEELNKLLKKVHKRKLSIQEDMEWEPLFEEQRRKAATLQADILRTDREIDALVYGLYGLSEAEVRIVEGSM